MADIKKDHRNITGQVWKMPKCGATKIKKEVMKEITEAFDVNYLSREYLVLQCSEYDYDYLPIHSLQNL